MEIEKGVNAVEITVHPVSKEAKAPEKGWGVKKTVYQIKDWGYSNNKRLSMVGNWRK